MPTFSERKSAHSIWVEAMGKLYVQQHDCYVVFTSVFLQNMLTGSSLCLSVGSDAEGYASVIEDRKNALFCLFTTQLPLASKNNNHVQSSFCNSSLFTKPIFVVPLMRINLPHRPLEHNHLKSVQHVLKANN